MDKSVLDKFRREQLSAMSQRDPDNRILIYMDILGFKNLVKDHGFDHIIKVMQQTYDSGAHLEKPPNLTMRDVYHRIMFSDTYLLYAESAGIHVLHAFQSIDLAGYIYCHLLTLEIPTRGAISYASFHVVKDNERKCDFYWGDALIEAYEYEKERDIIGIAVCPSVITAVNNLNQPQENKDYALSLSVQMDGIRWINPFYYLWDWKSNESLEEFLSRPHSQRNESLIYIEIRSIRVALDNSTKTKDERIKRKYLKTLELFEKCLKPTVFEKVIAVLSKLNDQELQSMLRRTIP